MHRTAPSRPSGMGSPTRGEAGGHNHGAKEVAVDRCEPVANAFDGLAGALVAGNDVVEWAQQLIDSSLALLPVDAAVILLDDSHGALQVLAFSGEQTRLLELAQIQDDDSPSMDAYRTGEAIWIDDLTLGQSRWPTFAKRTLAQGFRAVYALPLRLPAERVGVLELYRTQTGPMPATDTAVAQALAGVATIGILHQRVMTRAESVNQRLQAALNTRLIIEQAKGVLAERGAIDMDRAFALLRAYARSTNQRLVDLARAVVDGADTAAVILKPDRN